MLENAWKLIYFAETVDNFNKLLWITSITLGLFIVLYRLFCLFEGETYNLKKSVIITWFLFTITAILIPTKDVIYVYAGGKVANNAIQLLSESKYPKEIQKTIDNILIKINKELEDEPNSNQSK